MATKNYCLRYVKGTLEINFPDGELKCTACQLMDTDRTGRRYCRRSGEILQAPDVMIGYDCPLKFEKEETT